MSKHTPGPWFVQVTGGLKECVTAQENGLWATVEGTQRIENARLIAAAPDLLYIASWIEKEYEEGDGTIPDGLYNAARAAIKKATGGKA